MTSQATLKRQVDEIKQRILSPKDIVVIMHFPISKDASHGKYGGCKFHVFTGETEPLEPERELEFLRMGSLLHDVGKIAISDLILNKKHTIYCGILLLLKNILYIVLVNKGAIKRTKGPK